LVINGSALSFIKISFLMPILSPSEQSFFSVYHINCFFSIYNLSEALPLIYTKSHPQGGCFDCVKMDIKIAEINA